VRAVITGEAREAREIWVKSPDGRAENCDRPVGPAQVPNKGRVDEKGPAMNLFIWRTWLQAKFGKDEEGASMVEYILLVALIALAVIAAVVFLKDQVNDKFNDAGSQLSSSGN
jgi:Flp pilus assembly pilin Flp